MRVFRVTPPHVRSPFRWDPWQELEEIRRAMERMGTPPGGSNPVDPASFAVVPEVDLYDAGSSFTARVDVPGVVDESLDVTVEGSTLTIRGERTPAEVDGEGYVCCERPVGRFVRAIELPEQVDVDHVQAVLSRGVLEVTLPKAKATAVKKVAVTVRASE
jgi:HSP20 family protein